MSSPTPPGSDLPKKSALKGDDDGGKDIPAGGSTKGLWLPFPSVAHSQDHSGGNGRQRHCQQISSLPAVAEPNSLTSIVTYGGVLSCPVCVVP